MSLTEALGGVGKFWEPLGSFRVFGRLWKALEGFGRFWEALASEGFGKLLKSLKRLSLGGFWRYWRSFGGPGMV